MVISSDWYKSRLINKQKVDVLRIERIIENLEQFMVNPMNKSIIKAFNYDQKLNEAKGLRDYYDSERYFQTLFGTLGAEPIAL